jgi:hypothetical protein
MPARTALTARAVVFIGSSTDGLHIAKQLHRALAPVAEYRLWSEGIFELGRGTLESLIEATKQSDFAILVLTPDDLAFKKGRETLVPRDNVVFEIGLFMGGIGRHRTFVVVDRTADRIDLPSDLAGITYATYSVEKRTRRPNLRPVCEQIERAMLSRGKRSEESSGPMLGLLGDWNCTWFHERATAGQRPIMDTIRFRRVVEERVYAEGVNRRFGNYELTGRISRGGVLTFNYHGDERRQFSGGVVIMKLHANSRTKMSGYWYEFDANREIYGGETHWTKKP